MSKSIKDRAIEALHRDLDKGRIGEKTPCLGSSYLLNSSNFLSDGAHTVAIQYSNPYTILNIQLLREMIIKERNLVSKCEVELAIESNPVSIASMETFIREHNIWISKMMTALRLSLDNLMFKSNR